LHELPLYEGEEKEDEETMKLNKQSRENSKPAFPLNKILFLKLYNCC
jgi:hypothetical protein